MRWLLALAIGMPIAVSLAAEEERSGVDSAEADRASENARQELSHWKLTADSRLLVRTEKPVLRWSNPQVGRVFGDVYLYLRNGRPEAAVTVYRFFTPYQSLTAECVSLSESPLEARRDNQPVWTPKAGGLKFARISGSPSPAMDRAERLRQMRSLARQFSAILTDRRNAQTGDPQTLRLLPQPVFRQPAHGESVRDGAVFALVVGTDPEAYLVLETHEAGGERHWRYAFARMNRDAIAASHKGEEVWRVPALEVSADSSAAYTWIDLPKPD